MEMKEGPQGPITLHYNDFEAEGARDVKAGIPAEIEVDCVIGADGANSRVAKDIDAGECDYAVAFQERIKISPEQMKYYENLAEMYVGEDVSPDFYGWVFPKYDHVGVGTGSVMDKTGIRKYQTAIRDRCGPKIEGGKVIKVEAHPIPEHPRPKRCEGRVALVGEAVVAGTAQGTRMVGENDIRAYLHKWDKKYWLTYKVLDILQKVFYRSNPAREAFVEMCSSEYV